MILPVTVDSNATVGEQCLTAEMHATPPTGAGGVVAGTSLDDPSDNRVELCLGSPPLEPFDSGEVRTWTLYACKDGVADNMCDAADEVDVRVLATIEGSDEDLVLDNATALIHVKDVAGRVFDANSGSVTDGTTVSWQTATDEDPDFTGTREGVKVGIYRVPVNDYLDNWTNYHPTFKVSGADGGDPPGLVSVRSRTTGAALWALTSSNSWSAKRTNPFALSSMSTVVTVVMAEFEELGTYVLDFDVDMLHATIDDDSDSNFDTFSGTGRTIFHVGPIAELGVVDGGPSGDATTNQVAFTIAAVNNREEDPEGGKIVVELPTGTTGLTTVPASTGVFDRNANPPTWTWDIHDLELADRRASKGLPEGEVVTLIVEGVSAGETATANVVYDPYEVCIASDGTTAAASDQTTCEAISGASWHSGTVFDYNDDNDSATLTARAGGNAPGAPTLQLPAVHTPAVGFEWDEIAFLYGTPVKHYETEWSADGATESTWQPLRADVPETTHVDTGITAGETRYYRVRAVNQAGVKGPWSTPMAAMPIDPNVPAISISETALTIREGEAAEYTVTLHARPHSNVSVRVNGGGVVSPNPGTLTFTPLNFNMPQTVELTGIQDNDPDNEQVNVTHTISSSDAGYRSLAVDPVEVTVIDDDSGVSVAAERESVNEGEAIAFTLTRTGNTDSAITVDLSVSQRGSFLAAGQLGARSVDIGAGIGTKTVTVQTDNDAVRENPGSVTLVVSGGTGYLVGSPRSATVSVQDDDGPPGQPGDLAAEERDGEVRLSWSAAPTADAPVLDYYYRVRRSDRSTWDPDWTVLFGGGARFSHTVSDLINGQDYIIQVRARNDTGDGAVAEVTASPLDEPVPPDVTVTPRHESLLVTWTVADDGGRDITEYQVQWKSGGGDFDTSRQATATALEHTIPSLTNDTEYRVRVQARNEAGWSRWSSEQRGTPVARPATSVSITTTAKDGVKQPFRVTFTFTDEDHDGTQYGVTGFDVADIDTWYSTNPVYTFTLDDFREEKTGLVYSALVNEMLDGRLNIMVSDDAAESTHTDQQANTQAWFTIEVETPKPEAPSSPEIWATEMTVGDDPRNARGYINPDLSQWDLDDTLGSLSDGDVATDDDEAFTYAGKNYTVGEVSYVPAWSSILFSVCPGIEGVNRTFDLYLDDQTDGRDLTLSFDSDEVETSNFTSTIDGVRQPCVEYRWQPRQVDWQENSKVNVRLVR